MFKTRVKHGDYAFEERDRKAKGRNWRLALIMFAGLIAAMWLSSEYLAAALGYQPLLGSPLFRVGSLPVHAPHKYWIWMNALLKSYGTDNPKVMSFLAVGLLLQVGGLFLPAAVLKAQLRGKKARAMVEKLQGSARWAERDDIVDASLLPQSGGSSEGVYVGGWTDPKTKKLMYLRHNGPEHILAFAPTRSGKGVGLVLPTLLSWPESCFVLDIKGENYALTSGWRRNGAHNHILKFDPLDASGQTARYNPLKAIRIGSQNEHADIENIALLLADPDGTAAKGTQKHWIETSESLIVALLYHLLYTARYGEAVLNENNEPVKTQDGRYKRKPPFEPTLEKLRKMFTDNGFKSFKDYLMHIMQYPHMDETDEWREKGWLDALGKPTTTHPIAKANAMEAYQRPDNEAGSVLSTAANALKLFMDPAVAKNTSNATFSLDDITMLEKPVSLYVCVPPSQLNRLIPLLRILVTQIVTVLASELDYVDGRTVSKNKHRLLMMLDEFPTLGNMEVFETALAFIAGYGLKAYIIIQDLAQLQKRYTEKESIVSNTHVQVAYAPNKLETAKILSEMLGNTTAITEVRGKSVTKGVTTYTTNEQEKQRALLTPTEVMQLKGPLKNKEGLIEEPGDMIVRVSGFPPIRGTQILYFKDEIFRKRAQMKSVETSDVLTPGAEKQSQGNAEQPDGIPRTAKGGTSEKITATAALEDDRPISPPKNADDILKEILPTPQQTSDSDENAQPDVTLDTDDDGYSNAETDALHGDDEPDEMDFDEPEEDPHVGGGPEEKYYPDFDYYEGRGEESKRMWNNEDSEELEEQAAKAAND